MLKQIRQTVVDHLWEKYRSTSSQAQRIETALQQKNIQKLILDHFAIIDLPSPHTGISHLSQIFSAVGYAAQGRDYLPEKQNDFLWLTESDSFDAPAEDVLPQVVVADFRLDELPPDIRKIIEKYANQTPPSPVAVIQKLAKEAAANNHDAAKKLIHMMTNYLAGRDWPLPTLTEFRTVQEFNELLAWVLIFGRRPNHFTLSIHLLPGFKDLADFHCFITNEVGLLLNQEGHVIKGGKAAGIAQGSTIGALRTVALSDGNIELPEDFVEFVWRYPQSSAYPTTIQKPLLWKEYFTGFIARHADRVIESLYAQE